MSISLPYLPDDQAWHYRGSSTDWIELPTADTDISVEIVSGTGHFETTKAIRDSVRDGSVSSGVPMPVGDQSAPWADEYSGTATAMRFVGTGEFIIHAHSRAQQTR
jgi:hypothetical protein